MIWNPIQLDDTKPLSSHSLFWWPIILFVGGGILLSIPMWCFCIPPVDSYREIMERLAFPIFVASISVPISVMIARFHSSKVATKGNLLSEKNIAFNHYFDLKKHLREYIDFERKKIHQHECIDLVNVDQIFSVIFPRNSWTKTDLTVSVDEMVNTFEEWIKEVFENLMSVAVKDKEGPSYKQIARELSMPLLNGAFKHSPIQFNSNFVKVAWGDNESPLIQAINMLYDLVYSAMLFAKVDHVVLKRRFDSAREKALEKGLCDNEEKLDRFEAFFEVLIEDFDKNRKLESMQNAAQESNAAPQ